MSVTLVVSLAAHLGVAGGAALALWAHDDGHRSDAALAGDTLALPQGTDNLLDDVEEEELPPEPGAGAAPASDAVPAGPGASGALAAPGPSTRPIPSHAPRPKSAHAAGVPVPLAAGEAAEATGALYGAVGDRGAVDLATAFTRGFPQAASGDGAWLNVPFGHAGDGDVVIELDASGAIAHARVVGGISPTLRRGVERTLVLIKGRSFTAPGPTVRLHLAATVSPDQVHDGLHGDVFAIGGSFTGHTGSAFFALAVGRRVDLVVTSR